MCVIEERNDMRVEQLLEGISDVLFHITSLKNAAQIIEDDKFVLTHSFKNTSEEDASAKKLFFMSTSRSPTNDFNQRFRDDMVLMKLPQNNTKNAKILPITHKARKRL